MLKLSKSDQTDCILGTELNALAADILSLGGSANFWRRPQLNPMSIYLVTLDIEGVSRATYVTATDYDSAFIEAKRKLCVHGARIQPRVAEYISESRAK